jgi:serine phosphatase RsbU (regulator of sigma subunit)
MKRLLDLRLATPYYVAAFLFAVLTVVSFKKRRRLEGVRRTRVLIVTISVGLASLLCALQAVLARVNAWEFGDYVIYSFATLFAAFLAADLVVFQRQYFAERTKRAEQEAAKIQLEERLELGRSVQDILLPKKRTGSFRQFQYELFHIPAATMAGDWLYLWDASAQEKRVLFGDVMGKGPQAAIVVSAVMAFLYECRKRQLSVEQSIEYLNTSLSEIFYERTTSTFAAAVLYSDDQVDLYSCGTAGWFHATPRDVRHVAIRHQALGMGGKIKPEKVTIRMQAGNSLFSFSDGVLEGSRETKKLVALLGDYSSTKMSPSGLFNMACQVGGRQSGFDDQTMVVIKR